MDPQRQEIRARLGLTGVVLVYAGKAGGWYLTAEMLAFVDSARRVLGPVSLLVLSPDAAHRFPPPLGVPVVHRRALRGEMPAFLSAADAGLSFISSTPSKAACSPVKNGEYLACGLPIVSTAGIGDYSDLLDSTRTGVIVRELSSHGYLAAAEALRGLLAEPGVRERCRRIAERYVSLEEVLLPRYRAAYRELLSSGG
jgi:glycosyltransferase involved in cell wall biosynthesis